MKEKNRNVHRNELFGTDCILEVNTFVKKVFLISLINITDLRSKSKVKKRCQICWCNPAVPVAILHLVTKPITVTACQKINNKIHPGNESKTLLLESSTNKSTQH